MTQKNRIENISYHSIPQDSGDRLPVNDVDDLPIRRQINERYTQDTHFRKHLANWVMIIVPIWLFTVIVILILCGSCVIYFDKEILITLLATTTVNVLGVAYIVLKGIFPESKETKS